MARQGRRPAHSVTAAGADGERHVILARVRHEWEHILLEGRGRGGRRSHRGSRGGDAGREQRRASEVLQLGLGPQEWDRRQRGCGEEVEVRLAWLSDVQLVHDG